MAKSAERRDHVTLESIRIDETRALERKFSVMGNGDSFPSSLTNRRTCVVSRTTHHQGRQTGSENRKSDNNQKNGSSHLHINLLQRMFHSRDSGGIHKISRL